MSIDPNSFRSAPPREPSFKMSTPQLGMLLLLASLAVLFVASLAAYFLARINNPYWSNVSFGLPWGLAVATGFLALVSWQLERALNAIRHNRQQGLLLHLKLASAAAVAFLATQGLNWFDLQAPSSSQASHVLAMFSFYMLTGLHALHVLGGLVPLGLVAHHAHHREYSSSRYEGIRLLTQYWHFLGAVWLVLLVCMLAG